jgi:hypothetical protein
MNNRKATRVQPFFIFSIGVLTLTALGCARTMRPVSVEPGVDGDVGLAAYRVSEVEKAPHLITCADAQGPQPGTIAERALACRYQPGTISGHPVRVTMERTFRILAQP